MNSSKAAYIDTEPYCNPQIESLLNSISNIKEYNFLQEDNDWKFNIEIDVTMNDNKEIRISLPGIIGILTIDYDFYDKPNIWTVRNQTFTQLVGEYCNKENLIDTIIGVNRVVSYNGHLKPINNEGCNCRACSKCGFDFGILKSNYDVQLDNMPHVKSVDLMSICHRNGHFGGQKGAEKELGFERKSKVRDNKESLTNLIYHIIKVQLKEQNERSLKLQCELIKEHLSYNKEDVRGMTFIDAKLNNIQYIYNTSTVKKNNIRCKIIENMSNIPEDELTLCEKCNSYYLLSDKECKKCKDILQLPIYDVPETGCGHWTDTTGEDNHSTVIDIYNAIEIMKNIGTEIHEGDTEGKIEYYMIYDYTQEEGVPGLYIPKVTYKYIMKNYPQVFNS